MPLFDFKCVKCNKIFEQLVDNKDAIIFCECGFRANVVFNPTSSFHLKGKGWSKDGYSKKKSALDKSVVY